MQQQYETEKISKAKLEQDMVKLRQFYDSRLANVDGEIEKLPSTAESMYCQLLFLSLTHFSVKNSLVLFLVRLKLLYHTSSGLSYHIHSLCKV